MKKISALMAVMIFLSGCSGIHAMVKSSPCDAPCWRDIHMGDPKTEVLEKLNKMTDVDISSIENGESNRDFQEEYLSWSFSAYSDTGTIAFHESKVSYINLNTPYTLSLGTMIDLYGDPDKIKLTKSNLDGIYITVDFIYESGISFTSEKSLFSWQEIDEIEITTNTSVSSLYYYDVNLIGPDKYFMVTVNDIESTGSVTYGWNGYGKYKFLDQ